MPQGRQMPDPRAAIKFEYPISRITARSNALLMARGGGGVGRCALLKMIETKQYELKIPRSMEIVFSAFFESVGVWKRIN